MMKKKEKKDFKKKNIIKEYPYFLMLLVSGICGAAYMGITHIHSYAQVSEMTNQTQEYESEEAEQAQQETELVTSGSTQEEISTRQEDSPIGVTRFEYYDEKYVSTPYYQDPGKIAYTTDYPYQSVGDDYFSDAAFIGDSRMLGLYDYSGLSDADFFCDNGFCTYLWSKGDKVMWQNTQQKVILDDVIGQKHYTKIYIMLGLNDCGYGNITDFQKRYNAMMAMLHEKQPDAVIYLVANLHLSKEKSDSDDVYNNNDVNAHNVAIAELANGVTYFYLDSNSLFTDDQGYLKENLTFDGAHLYADGYQGWMDYFKEHAVVRGI